MALSTIVKNMRDGTLLIQDGTAVTPLDLTVQFEAGDFSVSGLNQAAGKAYNIAQYMDRGEIFAGGIRKTTQAPPTGSFTCYLTELSDGTNETVPDILLQQNKFSSAVSTLGADADCYALKLTWSCEGTDHGDPSDHTLALDDCLVTLDINEGDPNTFSISFTCLGLVTMT